MSVPRLGAFGKFAFGQEADSTPAAGAVTLVCTAYLIPGVALGNLAVAYGEPRMPLRIAAQDGYADGEILIARARLIAGRAKGNAAVGARTLVRYTELIAGSAFAEASAQGVPLQVVVELRPGIASGVRNLTDEEILILAEAA